MTVEARVWPRPSPQANAALRGLPAPGLLSVRLGTLGPLAQPLPRLTAAHRCISCMPRPILGNTLTTGLQGKAQF